MRFVAVITPRTEPEMYQSATIEAKAIRLVESVEKIFSTAVSIARAVAGCTCGFSAGNIVSFQTCRWPTAPSMARPSSVNGTSAFITANEIPLARSSSSCLLKRSIQILTKLLRRMCTRLAYPKTRAASLAGRVRYAVRPPAERPRRPAQAGLPRRGVDLARDARGAARAARGGRQLRGREGVRRPRARARARRRRGQEPDARPAGGEDRPGGADRADGLRRLPPRLRGAAADGDPARRPAGRRQDDRRREARAAAAQGGPQARSRRRRPAAPGRDRPARPAGEADSGAGVHRQGRPCRRCRRTCRGG